MFNIDARKFLLTYPQCTLDKETLLTSLQSLGEIKWYTVCIEPHSDGTPHLHACVHYSRKIHSTNSRFFDIGQYHPNIQTLKTAADFQRSEAYCRKHGDFVSNVDTKISKRTLLAKRILEYGKITRELIEENPEIIFCNYASISSWLADFGPKKVKLSYPTNKKRHYWLYGPSNCGKTYQLRQFLEDKNSCEIPINDDYRCNDQTQVLWADEYKGNITVQALNRLCDGNTQLNKKGGSTHILFPIIVICSNFSIRDCYPKVNDDIYNTLTNRFIEIDLSKEQPDW